MTGNKTYGMHQPCNDMWRGPNPNCRVLLPINTCLIFHFVLLAFFERENGFLYTYFPFNRRRRNCCNRGSVHLLLTLLCSFALKLDTRKLTISFLLSLLFYFDVVFIMVCGRMFLSDFLFEFDVMFILYGK